MRSRIKKRPVVPCQQLPFWMKTASVTLKWACISGSGVYRYAEAGRQVGRQAQVDDSRGVRNYLFHLHTWATLSFLRYGRRALLLIPTSNTIGAPPCQSWQKAIIIIPVITAMPIALPRELPLCLHREKKGSYKCLDRSNILSRKRGSTLLYFWLFIELVKASLCKGPPSLKTVSLIYKLHK